MSNDVYLNYLRSGGLLMDIYKPLDDYDFTYKKGFTDKEKFAVMVLQNLTDDERISVLECYCGTCQDYMINYAGERERCYCMCDD
jgi:hypothetical protein